MARARWREMGGGAARGVGGVTFHSEQRLSRPYLVLTNDTHHNNTSLSSQTTIAIAQPLVLDCPHYISSEAKDALEVFVAKTVNLIRSGMAAMVGMVVVVEPVVVVVLLRSHLGCAFICYSSSPSPSPPLCVSSCPTGDAARLPVVMLGLSGSGKTSIIRSLTSQVSTAKGEAGICALRGEEHMSSSSGSKLSSNGPFEAATQPLTAFYIACQIVTPPSVCPAPAYVQGSGVLSTQPTDGFRKIDLVWSPNVGA